MRTIAAVLALTVAAGLAPGCAHLPLDPAYAGPVRADPVASAFTYEPGPAPYTVAVRETTPDYTIRRVHLESKVNVVESHTIVIDYYDVGAAAPVPAILVLPIMGGGNRLARILAESFARRGWAALIVHRQEGFKDVDELELMNPVFRQIVLDHKQALDWMETRPELDAGRIGLMGVSAGAVKGVLVAALDDRIGATVLGLVGGDVPAIFAYSRDKGLTEKRNAILEEHGITADELYRVLTDEFIHDPLVYAPRIDAREILLVLAAFDAVIPYRQGIALRETMGRPRTIVLPTGHYGAVLFLPYIEQVARRFFAERLAVPPGPS